MKIKHLEVESKRTRSNHMPHKLMDRSSFNACIDAIIREKQKNTAEVKRLNELNVRLEKCEDFLRGLMRTHTHLPKDEDKRPQFFMFSRKTGEPALVRGFLAKNTENLMPKMIRIGREEALMKTMSNGKKGFVVGVYPFNDFELRHSRFIVDFQTWSAEILK